MSTSTLTKDIVIAHAGRNFVNGDQEFDLTTADIDECIKNFGVLGKQVPLILTPKHLFGSERSAIPAAGWVQKMYRDGDAWHAVCKFIGEAAEGVGNDQFRGVSVGVAGNATDVHGKAVGQALDHVLITNSPFLPRLNIAASQTSGEVRYLTSIPASVTEERSYISTFPTEAVFNKLSLIQQARSWINAAAALVGAGRTRALQEASRLRAKIAAANDAPPIQVPRETFVTRTCIYPGCNQKFETSGSRLMCNEHVHRPKPDPNAVLAPVAYRLQKPLGRPTEAGPDSNPSRGDQMSRFVPEVSPLQQARDAYAEALALGDSEACSEAMEKIVRLTRAAAAPSPQMLKQIVPDSFSGHGENPNRGGTLRTLTCKGCGGEYETSGPPRLCNDCLTKPRPTVY